jgi:hypothetical protein
MKSMKREEKISKSKDRRPKSKESCRKPIKQQISAQSLSMRLAVRNRLAHSVPTSENSTVHNYKQISFNPACQWGSGAPCRQFGFAGYFLSINFLTMRELKEVLTKKVLAFLLQINREVGGGRNCL